MFTDEDKLVVRAFYSDLFDQLNEQMFSVLDVHDFLSDRSVGHLKLGDEQGYLLPAHDFEDYIELKRINPETVPQTIIDAFERHIWYSQHNLSDINVFKYDVGEQETFAIYIAGYVDDGWDNGCHLLEVYDGSGELVGATTSGRDWKENPLDHQDYFHIPPAYGAQVQPIWLQQYIREIDAS